MWQSIATFKENLSQIASEVLDTAEELEIAGSSNYAIPEEENHGRRSSGNSNSSSFSLPLPPPRLLLPLSPKLPLASADGATPRMPIASPRLGLGQDRHVQGQDVQDHDGLGQGEGQDAQQVQVQHEEEEQQEQPKKMAATPGADRRPVLSDLREREKERERERQQHKQQQQREQEEAAAQQLMEQIAMQQEQERQMEMERQRERKRQMEQDQLRQQVASLTAERDIARRDLQRLRQHLLDKDAADSQKMDEDSQHIAELEERAAASQAQAERLEQALALASQQQARNADAHALALQRLTAERDSLQLHLQRTSAALQSKDEELSNLQIALGQYCAEIEARDRIHLKLAAVKEEASLLAANLSRCTSDLEAALAARDEAVDRVAELEARHAQDQANVHKLEEEVVKLRRALEHTISSLNRMSTDSQVTVDKGIVVKLLVTYFQKNHSKEVLDLMARILGFTDQEKAQVGLAQRAATGGGIVKGVLGRPARFVGGLLGSSAAGSPRPSTANSATSATAQGSFSDLWIDFLLKESEERERREKANGAAPPPPPGPSLTKTEGPEDFEYVAVT